MKFIAKLRVGGRGSNQQKKKITTYDNSLHRVTSAVSALPIVSNLPAARLFPQTPHRLVFAPPLDAQPKPRSQLMEIAAVQSQLTRGGGPVSTVPLHSFEYRATAKGIDPVRQ